MAALSGVRVLDVTQFEAGTTCTLVLAWLGADVIKVERPGVGDQAREATTDIPGEDSPYFLLLNANKRSVTLDLKSTRGIEVMRKLIANADVFVENFAPGTIERLGLGYDDLRELNPRIIYAQIKGFDVEGPFGSFLCFDPVGQAAGGALSLTGYQDGPPLKPGINIADTGTGVLLSAGILGALMQRERTGLGQRVQINMQEAVINYARVAFQQQISTGEAVERYGNEPVLRNAPAGLFPCAPEGPNDYVIIHCSRANNVHWHNLLALMGQEHLTTDERLGTPEDRWRHREEIDELVSTWTRKYDKRTAMELLGRAKVPASAVFDTSELSADEHLVRNGTFVDVEHPTRGEVRIPGWCVRMSDSEVSISVAPRLGEHTDDVLAGVAGLSDSEIDDLREQGIV